MRKSTKLFCRSAFVLWVSMNIMILVVPRYGAYLMALTGLMMLFSDALFWKLIPKRPLMIHIEVSEELGGRFASAPQGVLRDDCMDGRVTRPTPTQLGEMPNRTVPTPPLPTPPLQLD